MQSTLASLSQNTLYTDVVFEMECPQKTLISSCYQDKVVTQQDVLKIFVNTLTPLPLPGIGMQQVRRHAPEHTKAHAHA